LRFKLPSGIAVSAPWHPLKNGFYHVGHTPAHWPASVAFGHFKEREIKLPGAALRLAILDATPPAQVDAQMGKAGYEPIERHAIVTGHTFTIFRSAAEDQFERRISSARSS
jgi:hypothetical protein